ncbi:MAG: SDR family oxidoreductase [Proteobacteria bacterium]|nr:SDR family oxidoreductase [Pseudomonadota bacterium]
MANTTLFLVSEEARNITGQSINVDGGMSIA